MLQKGSGCGSVGSVDASHITGHQIETSDQQNFVMNIFPVFWRKDKNKEEKRLRMAEKNCCTVSVYFLFLLVNPDLIAIYLWYIQMPSSLLKSILVWNGDELVKRYVSA